jgi:predicted amidohydrolase
MKSVASGLPFVLLLASVLGVVFCPAAESQDSRGASQQSRPYGLKSVAAEPAGLPASHEDPPSAPRRRELRVAAVQLSIASADLSSFTAFRSHLENLLRSLAFQPDLVVFPEYTSVFLTLVPYYATIRDSGSVEEALARIAARDPLVKDFRDLFLLNSGLTERAMEALFAPLARRCKTAVLAGTYFAQDEQGGGVRLVNRAVLFDSAGRIVYCQDKVYLTPFEEEVLGISAGRAREVLPFTLGEHKVGLTICRDTFFEIWEQVLTGSDLWIDIKANGTLFTAEERQRFLKALPARIGASNVPYGLTVCLTGSLLDLLWEGESSVLGKGPGGTVRFLRRAACPAEEEILLLTVP